jgi:hypothetical protein
MYESSILGSGGLGVCERGGSGGAAPSHDSRRCHRHRPLRGVYDNGARAAARRGRPAVRRHLACPGHARAVLCGLPPVHVYVAKGCQHMAAPRPRLHPDSQSPDDIRVGLLHLRGAAVSSAGVLAIVAFGIRNVVKLEEGRPVDRVTVVSLIGASALGYYVPVIYRGTAAAMSGRFWPEFTAAVCMTACHSLGGVCYALHWPQRQFPGRFDVCGFSHNIMLIITYLLLRIYYYPQKYTRLLPAIAMERYKKSRKRTSHQTNSHNNKQKSKLSKLKKSAGRDSPKCKSGSGWGGSVLGFTTAGPTRLSSSSSSPSSSNPNSSSALNRPSVPNTLPCSRYVLPQTEGTCWVAAALTATLSSDYIKKLINIAVSAGLWNDMPESLKVLSEYYKSQHENYERQPVLFQVYRFYKLRGMTQRLLLDLDNPSVGTTTPQEPWRRDYYKQILAILNSHVAHLPMSSETVCRQLYDKFPELIKTPSTSHRTDYDVVRDGGTHEFLFKLVPFLLPKNHIMFAIQGSIDMDTNTMRIHHNNNTNLENNDGYNVASFPDVIVLQVLPSQHYDRSTIQSTAVGNHLFDIKLAEFYSGSVSVNFQYYTQTAVNYVVDSVVVRNVVQSNITSTGHTIAGVTCLNKRYIYNGWHVGNNDARRRVCGLMEYDWLEPKKSHQLIALSLTECRLLDDPEDDTNIGLFQKLDVATEDDTHVEGEVIKTAPREEITMFNTHAAPRVYILVRV